MSFSIKRLTGHRAVVSGKDSAGTEGTCVVDTYQWDSINAHDKQHVADELFGAVVEKFFSPITAAAEKLSQAVADVADEDEFVVLHEAVEAQPGRPADVVRLTRDSMILRFVESGNTDRLVWVGDELEILEPAGKVDPLQTAIEEIEKQLGGVVIDETPAPARKPRKKAAAKA